MPPDMPAPAHPVAAPKAQPALPQSDAARPPAPATNQPAQAVPGRGDRAPSPPMMTAPGTGKARTSARKHRKKQPAAVPQAIMTPPPAQPPPPPTPGQMPPVAPRVGYRNGLMTVTAENSRLGDILQAIRQLTGATMDVPPQANEERVVFRYGPASPRDVVTALLNGSRYNYVIVGSPANPGAVQRLMMSGQRGDGGAFAGNMPQPGSPMTPIAGSPPRPSEDAEAPDTDEPPQPQPRIVPTPAPGQSAQPVPQPAPFPGMQPAAPVVQPTPDRNPPEGQQPQVKTPEQLLEELKRMQQQQQQQKPPK